MQMGRSQTVLPAFGKNCRPKPEEQIIRFGEKIAQNIYCVDVPTSIQLCDCVGISEFPWFTATPNKSSVELRSLE